jgi:N-acetylglutamate synthase-like GNAT family acetyltransferase
MTVSLQQPLLTKVDGSHPLYEQVKQQFEQVIAPIYGDQTQALQKIQAAQDRHCYVLDVAQKVAGIAVYKIQPTDEFPVKKALEIKTLFVVNAQENSGKGYGSQLLSHIELFARQQQLFEHLVVTVSETKPESKAFFEKKGFSVVQTSSKFKATEYILAKKV